MRDLRVQRGLTLREVAAAVGLDQAHLSKAELGQRLPTPAQVDALARFFRQDRVEFEAHCIAEKFRRRHAGSAAALHAIRLLHGEQVQGKALVANASDRIPLKKTRLAAAKPVLPEPEASEVKSISDENPGVVILHAD